MVLKDPLIELSRLLTVLTVLFTELSKLVIFVVVVLIELSILPRPPAAFLVACPNLRIVSLVVLIELSIFTMSWLTILMFPDIPFLASAMAPMALAAAKAC